VKILGQTSETSSLGWEGVSSQNCAFRANSCFLSCSSVCPVGAHMMAGPANLLHASSARRTRPVECERFASSLTCGIVALAAGGDWRQADRPI
jgi:hypothetical protein